MAVSVFPSTLSILAQCLRRPMQMAGVGPVLAGSPAWVMAADASAGQSDDAGLTLDNIEIKAAPQVETGDGPVKGYVAKRTTTGTKTDTPINEIPQTISVITRDGMDQRGVQDFNSAVAYTPAFAPSTMLGASVRPTSSRVASALSTCSASTRAACALASTSTTLISKLSA